jgi:hypothetical protein
MVYVVLYLVGALLVVNGLTMAQIITAFNPVAGEASIPVLALGYSAIGIGNLNWFIGGLIGIMALIIVTKDLLAAFGETVSATAAATVLTFSIAYMTLGAALNNMYNPVLMGYATAAVGDGASANPFVGFAAFQPLGWYCLPMSAMFLVIGLGFFHFLGKKLPKVPQFGVLWILWSITFFLFFYVFGLGNYGAGLSMLILTGWWAFAIGIITCAYPALANFNSGKVGAW